jgi:hypothetical protein
MPAGEKATIQVHIRNDSDISPGGHYGAVIFSQQNSSSGQVGVNPSVASLFFVTKTGGEKYQLDLRDVEASSNWWGRIGQTTADFFNDGNVHAVPRGTVVMYDSLGMVLGQGVINADSSIILPGQSRELAIPMRTQGLALWPGRYKIEVTYRYDGSEVLQMHTQTFYRLGLAIPLIAIAGLVVGGWYIQKRMLSR